MRDRGEPAPAANIPSRPSAIHQPVSGSVSGPRFGNDGRHMEGLKRILSKIDLLKIH